MPLTTIATGIRKEAFDGIEKVLRTHPALIPPEVGGSLRPAQGAKVEHFLFTIEWCELNLTKRDVLAAVRRAAGYVKALRLALTRARRGDGYLVVRTPTETYCDPHNSDRARMTGISRLVYDVPYCRAVVVSAADLEAERRVAIERFRRFQDAPSEPLEG